jgi:selenocysteine-specific elongation factor
MIVTLAGHVDHGKTSLVEALTGVNTDTLAEERRRGLTIDLGFSYTDIAGRRIGFVDVPGHHRFIHNMVAGVAAHQHALLVVAADDGPMPQTLEHLALLRLLGVERGVAAVTKVDCVEPDRFEEVRSVVATLARESGLHLSGIVGTSCVDGTGLDTLRQHIASAAVPTLAVQLEQAFRLAIDRAFVINGVGVVVTGTIHSGVVEKGSDVAVAPRGLSARIRSLRVSDRAADRGVAGDRCAIGLGGVSLEQVERGDWLVAPTTLASTHNIVVDLQVLTDFPRSVRHWLPVHVYHATSHTEGHVALLESAPLTAGQSAMVELVLATPLHPKYGDRLVLRDHAMEHTIGGGRVIDIAPPEKARRATKRLASLDAKRTDDATLAMRRLIELEDVDIDAFRRLRNLTDDTIRKLLGDADHVLLTRGARTVAVSKAKWSAALGSLATQISAYHKAAPHSQGLKADQIRRTGVVPKEWLDDALAALAASGTIAETGGHFHQPNHRAALPPEEAAVFRRIQAAIRATDQPPSIGDLAKSLGMPLRSLDALSNRLAKLGFLIRAGDHRVLLPDQLDKLVATAQRLAEATPTGFTARDFRDAASIGRNLAIEVLEYFDRCGFTRRYGEVRRIVGAPSMLNRA